MKKSNKPRPRLFVLNDPHPMRISGDLALEIGFNESIVLLQLEYLIGISTTEKIQGNLWTYQTLEELRNYFPWWSITTISRILKSLEAQKLIFIGNFNKLGYDRTQWFALNPEGINQLKSIQLDMPIFQNEKWKSPNCKMEPAKMKNGTRQNETTIPETPTETPTEIMGEGTPPAININAFSFYENEIGPLTPMIAEKLGDAVDDHTEHWTIEAIKIASQNGKRSWAYIDAILKRWEVDGYGSELPAKKRKSNGSKDQDIFAGIREFLQDEEIDLNGFKS